MTEIITIARIRKVLPRVDLVEIIEEGFAAYSRGEVVVPPVGELLFEDPPGETHIKYGYIKGDDYYVIKVASGFYQNPKIGLPSGEGLMLLFCQKTGLLMAVLLDGGYLTDVRTAAAGAVAAKHLAPATVQRIGIIGAGAQGRLQLDALQGVIECRRALVWVPDPSETEPFLDFFEGSGFEIETTDHIEEVPDTCNLIVTATPSTAPLLDASQIRQGTHITAVGSDTAAKIELDPAILAMADAVVADSLPQSESRGEVFRAVKNGAIDRDRVVELGKIVMKRARGRTSDSQITVCDLTGVAVQDYQIAKAVYESLVPGEES
jgi:ornithine cyclodeaminase